MALYTLISLAGGFFAWRNFMKNKEYALSIVERAAVKYNLDLLEDTVCLRKLNLWFENKMLVFYLVYSFDYNNQSSEDRYICYIVIRNVNQNDFV
ncbi:DUF3301 domain-containing protein, partial [Francisella tularensis]|uniref:DUF3301 domain-containing protein n=1 Tax=Francisella tularensis TaxID=263 RepID=UPI002381C69E